MSKGWDSGMLKKLKALVGKGLSTAEMGKKLGMSKNAVVGKLNRLGWNSKAAEPVAKTSGKKAEKKSEATETKKTATGPKAKSAGKKKVEIAVKKTAPVKAGKTVAKKTETVDVKTPKIQLKEVKTASKKTKKDLALHELLVEHALQMANLKPNQCRWPIGDPDSDNFHFCGETVFSGKPYCYEHCRQAYQFTAPKKK